MSMRSMGLGGALVVFVSVLAALTLLPALLGMGPRVNSLRVAGRRSGGGLFWRRWSDWVMRTPIPVLVGSRSGRRVRVAGSWASCDTFPARDGSSPRLRVTAGLQSRDSLRHGRAPPVEVLVTWAGEQDAFAPGSSA